MSAEAREHVIWLRVTTTPVELEGLAMLLDQRTATLRDFRTWCRQAIEQQRALIPGANLIEMSHHEVI